MTEAMEAEKNEVRRVVGDLEAIRERLAGVVDRLPADPAEDDPEEDMEAAEESTELRTVIRCALHDSLRPLIEDLRTVAVPRPK